jgi:hypothetical protein
VGEVCVCYARLLTERLTPSVIPTNPMRATTDAMCADAGVSQMKPPFGNSLATLSLQPGQLVLFPSWVVRR